MNGWIVATVLLAAIVPVAVAGWAAPRSRLLAGLVVGLFVVAALVAVTLADPIDTRAGQAMVVTVCGLVAVAGGGPVTTGVFSLVDDGHPEAERSVSAAGEVLRGGAWIGALERLGVLVLLLAGWPEGLAIVLGLKGLGRYPELRARHSSGAAERFIIGTFASVLWAAACAGVASTLA